MPNWFCKRCGKSFRVRKELQNHYKKNPDHRTDHHNKIRCEYVCKYCQKKRITTLEGIHVHEKYCCKNPNKKISYWQGKKHSEESKIKTSKSMKSAHEQGRAWNIGKSRWNNKPSYPEKFFMKAIKNNFLDKNYVREYNIGIYSLDFAWITKKKCIEIDGDQHQRFDTIKKRDQRKNDLCAKNGWQILRIKWKDLFDNPKEWIRIANEFIGE